ncbi:MAG TPA: GNAT family N-acetyltransferase [Caulobacteraceae bacterium]|nr:GNAT family N-acetyltransferase [Caulobacteraceae bacterium]
MTLAPAARADAPAMARTHAASFADSWTAADIAALIDAPGGFAFLVRADDAIAGFALARAIAGEAELLTLAVDPRHRRRGVAQALLEAVCGAARAAGAASLFLEVAADNTPALSLYAAAGFVRVGQRPAYYEAADGRFTDALVLRRALNSPAG